MTFAPFALRDLLAEVKGRCFPAMGALVSVGFQGGYAPLACVSYTPFPRQGTARIAVHSALDRPDTPLDVVRFLLKHELIHVERESARGHGGGRRPSHPAAFWEREREVAPEAEEMWEWIESEVGHCLERDHRRECVFVVPKRTPRRGPPRWALYPVSVSAQNQDAWQDRS